MFFRLEITLRFLATGESFRSLMYYTRVHESTISRFIPEICTAICTVLESKYFKVPILTFCISIVTFKYILDTKKCRRMA